MRDTQSDHLLVKPKQSTERPVGDSLRAVLVCPGNSSELSARIHSFAFSNPREITCVVSSGKDS